MLLSKIRTNSLVHWRSLIALSFTSAAVVASGCGAPPPGGGAEGTTDGAPAVVLTTSDSGTTNTSVQTSGGKDDIVVTDTTGMVPDESTTAPLGVDGEFCSKFDIEFLPKETTVYVLVDQSSSMFGDPNSSVTNFWDPLKTGVLEVVNSLQSDVRFGFSSYTGTSGMCDGLQASVPIAVNNYDAIKAVYDGLGDLRGPNTSGPKGETPTPAAVMAVTDILTQDPVPGEKYLLLVTDGDPDFCDDNSRMCASDATVAAIQQAAALGIKTLVFGLMNKDIQDPALFDYYAQAGIGEQPAWESGLDFGAYSGTIEGQCKVNPQAELWAQLRTALGNAPDPTLCDPLPSMGDPNCFKPAANYSAAGGTAKAFVKADPMEIAAQIGTSVAQFKSCVIDVNFVVADGGESKGEIYVGDLVNPIPMSDWHMTTTSQIELLGQSCELWKLPDTKDFFAGFPCEVIVEQPIIR